MKEVVLDTETTGFSVSEGHRIVEIGCIELDNLIPTQNKEFSDFFKKNKMPLNEVQVYETQLKPKKIKNEIDGIMFFSPSGIKSFKLKNEIGNVPCFSIGDTTSEYLTKFTSNIHTAKDPSVENVIKLAVQHLANE